MDAFVQKFACPFYTEELCILDHDVCPFAQIPDGFRDCGKWLRLAGVVSSDGSNLREFDGVLESIPAVVDRLLQ